MVYVFASDIVLIDEVRDRVNSRLEIDLRV